MTVDVLIASQKATRILTVLFTGSYDQSGSWAGAAGTRTLSVGSTGSAEKIRVRTLVFVRNVWGGRSAE